MNRRLGPVGHISLWNCQVAGGAKALWITASLQF